jgi:peptidyl-prolyl cis-trans isomerase SurA
MMGGMNRIAASVRFALGLVLIWWPVISHAEMVDRIVAIVNADAITLSEIDEAINPFVKQIRDAPYGPDEKRQLLLKIRQDMLNKMIDEKLTEQESQRLGVAVHESEIDKRVEAVKSDNYLTDEDLAKALEAEGYTLDDYREQIKEKLLSMKLVNIEVKSKIAITEDEVREYYENHKKDFGGEQKYHLRTILIRVSSWEQAEDKENAIKKTEIVVDALKAGTPFEDVARQYSEDPSAKEGGDVGSFTIDELAPELQETVRWLREGDVSSVLRTAQGYQLIMVDSVEVSSGKTLEEAKAEIQERMFREKVEKKYKAWLEALRERSYIKVIQ